MNCKEFLENIDDFVEGKLTRRKDSEMHKHMRICQNCKEAFDKKVSVKKAHNGVLDVLKENCSSKKSSTINSINKGKYRFKYIKWLTAIVIIAAVCILYNLKLAGSRHFAQVDFKNAISVNSENMYKLYSTDANTGRQLSNDITIANNLTLEEKLNTIASKLSQTYFKNLPIKVLRIEQVNGKKVAIINLDESDENKGKRNRADYSEPNWAAGFLQGSTGADITSSSLINSFLQRNVSGEWIDGVRILYRNKPCDFEHAPVLGGIVYR